MPRGGNHAGIFLSVGEVWVRAKPPRCQSQDRLSARSGVDTGRLAGRDGVITLRLMSVFKYADYSSVGLIVTIVSPAFGKLAEADQLKRMARLQECAEAAGLRGTVVPVWKNDDTYEFLTPAQFEKFLTNLQWTEILGRIKGKFPCD